MITDKQVLYFRTYSSTVSHKFVRVLVTGTSFLALLIQIFRILALFVELN